MLVNVDIGLERSEQRQLSRYQGLRQAAFKKSHPQPTSPSSSVQEHWVEPILGYENDFKN
jgi:hypothetical protein